MVHAFVVFALLLVAAWIRLLTIGAPAPYGGTNGAEWSAYGGSVMLTAFSTCVGGSLACITFAATSLVRRTASTVERGTWLLAAPASTIATWLKWWHDALGVGV